MKSLFLILFSSALVFSLTACDNKKSDQTPTVAQALSEARAAGVEIETRTYDGQTEIFYMSLYDVPKTEAGVLRAQRALDRLKDAIRRESRSEFIEHQSLSYILLAQEDLSRCLYRLEGGYNRCYLGNVG